MPKTTRGIRTAAWALAACAAIGSAGCLPRRVTIDLQPEEPELEQTIVIADEGASHSSPKVAMIDVRGLISDGAAGGILTGGRARSPVDDLVARLDRAARDGDVRAVLLRINSPGGTVAASETMYAEIRRFAERTGKPVIASLGEVAASGGYYIALAADEIIAQPSTTTGSIGVIVQTLNVSGGMARIGITARSVTSGPNKALASPFETEREAHYAILQQMVDDFYGQFRGLVAQRRPRIPDQAMPMLTDGRVVTGAEAARLGLVDGTGGVREAFARARERANLGPACLIKYHADGDSPRTAYAIVDVPEPSAAARGWGAGGTQINLMQMNLGLAGAEGASGFYYLWVPPSP